MTSTDRSSLILRVGIDTLFTSIVTFSLFLLFAGHNNPGGGFVGGLVAGAALVLRFMASGGEALRRTTRFPAPVYLGTGLAVAATTGLSALLAGDAFLEVGHIEASLGALGDIKVASSLVFDVGVYLIIVGFVLLLLDVVGADPVPPEVTGGAAPEGHQ